VKLNERKGDCMLERELTSGTIPLALKKSRWTWDRIPDVPNNKRHTVGYDGWFVRGAFAVRCEVKVGNRPLTPSESDKRDKCQKRGEPYVILRWWPKSWTLECDHQTWTGTLLECLVGAYGYIIMR
jgi:hypothetical protein